MKNDWKENFQRNLMTNILNLSGEGIHLCWRSHNWNPHSGEWEQNSQRLCQIWQYAIRYRVTHCGGHLFQFLILRLDRKIDAPQLWAPRGSFSWKLVLPNQTGQMLTVTRTTAKHCGNNPGKVVHTACSFVRGVCHFPHLQWGFVSSPMLFWYSGVSPWGMRSSVVVCHRRAGRLHNCFGFKSHILHPHCTPVLRFVTLVGRATHIQYIPLQSHTSTFYVYLSILLSL